MDTAEFKKVMGSFPTGVAVITTSVDGWLHGITVNSVTSVSLEPLLVLVCIETTARAHDQLEAARRFGISFLRDDQEPLSRTFAARGLPELGRLRGMPFRWGSHGTALLHGSLASLECDLVERIPAGDHSVFLGAALGGEADIEGRPLVYFRGRYGRLAP